MARYVPRPFGASALGVVAYRPAGGKGKPPPMASTPEPEPAAARTAAFVGVIECCGEPFDGFCCRRPRTPYRGACACTHNIPWCICDACMVPMCDAHAPLGSDAGGTIRTTRSSAASATPAPASTRRRPPPSSGRSRPSRLRERGGAPPLWRSRKGITFRHRWFGKRIEREVLKYVHQSCMCTLSFHDVHIVVPNY